MNKWSHVPKEIPDIAARFRDDGDAKRHPRANGDLLNSLADTKQPLNELSHGPEEIPDIATRFRDDGEREMSSF